MKPETDFYNSGKGDCLVNSRNYPPEIKSYLQSEKEVLKLLSNKLKGIVEVGCMNGRYVEWALAEEKLYYGIDIIERYIEAGLKRLKKSGIHLSRVNLQVWSANSIHEFVIQERLSQVLLFFLLIVLVI